MARNAHVALPAGSFTELSNGEDIAGAVKVQNFGSGDIILVATVDATEPTTTGGGTLLKPGFGLNDTLANLFPGVTSPVRLWAYSAITGTASVQYA